MTASGDTTPPPIADEKAPYQTGVLDGQDGSTNSDEPHQAVSKVVKRTWRSYIWDSLDKSREERHFVFKLDVFLMTAACLGNFIKYLDQVNIHNAFVSGMKEDLELYGNELNYMVMTWMIGYVIGEIPSNLIITRIRPSIWIPACEVTWSVLTILLVTCKNASHIYVLRFFIGLAEAAFYPGVTYVIGSWYRKDELGKRTTIFLASQAIGAMFSGYLMTATHNLDGVHGYRGWQWLFIVCGIISLPIAFASFFLLPDTPETTRALYLKKSDVAIANTRMVYEGHGKRSPYTKAKFKRIFTSWRIYALVLMYVLWNNNGNFGGQPGFALWLKDEGHPISSINLYPTIALALCIVLALIYAWTSDSLWRGARWPVIVIATGGNLILYISMAIWDIPIGYKWTYYILSGLANGLGGLLYAWATEICAADTEERALVVGAMNTIAGVVQVWLPLIIWQQVDAPRYKKGFITMACISTALIATTFLVRHLHKREKAQKARAEQAQGEE